jgi:acetoin utilization protein AcuB
VEIEKWMKHPVYSVKPLDSIQHARELMEQHRVNQLPVVVDGRVVGIVTDRDLRDAFPSVFDSTARREATKSRGGTNPNEITVEMVMTPNVLTLGSKDSVAKAVQLMRNERIGAIPIVDANRLVGILTRSDVLDAFVALVDPGSSGQRPL